ncbi:MAG: EF-hand domain-containing protein [Mariprofundaceae bacterium]|nr:EF-hand domain-containing protein [Mariprofundaceae bacterium]
MLLRSLIAIAVLLVMTPENTATAAGVTTNKLANRFIALDRNGDGVSFAEFMTMIESRARREYKEMDGNGDGRVSRYEYKRFWSARKAQYYRIKR